MRWLIASLAFILPVLIAVHIAAAAAAGPDAAIPAIGSAGVEELRSWLIAQRVLIDRYAPLPGTPERSGMPHLALERFDRCGCDRHGNPWFRLAIRPAGVHCGVLRREAPDRPLAPERERRPDLLLRIAGNWLYWEWRELPPTPAQSRP